MYVCMNVEQEDFLEHIYIYIYMYILHTTTAHRVYTYVHNVEEGHVRMGECLFSPNHWMHWHTPWGGVGYITNTDNISLMNTIVSKNDRYGMFLYWPWGRYTVTIFTLHLDYVALF